MNKFKFKFKMKHEYLYIILLFCLFIYFYFGYNKQINELFTNKNEEQTKSTEWSDDLKKRFIQYQYTTSQNDFNYDLKILQEQVSAQEAEEYLKTGKWNWDDELKKLYMDKVSSSTLVKIMPEQSLDYAMRMYNKNAVKNLLAWNYKEGEFLLYGAKDKDGNIIKCSPNISGEQSVLKDSTGKIINNENIPNVINGFSFYDKSCNPCVALNYPMDTTCAFKLNLKNDDKISDIWKKIWNL